MIPDSLGEESKEAYGKLSMKAKKLLKTFPDMLKPQALAKV